MEVFTAAGAAEVCKMLFQLLGSCITRGRERGWARLERGHPAVEWELEI